MSKTPLEVSLQPINATPPPLSQPLAMRTDLQLHIQAVWELIDVLLSQLEIVQNDSIYSDEVSCLNLPEEVRRFEKSLIQRALTRARGSQVQAARCLGLKATTLNAKIKRYRLDCRYLIQHSPAALHQPNTESCEGV
jgi:transcriptional regulator with GAF, ATPase, and Fis domain